MNIAESKRAPLETAEKTGICSLPGCTNPVPPSRSRNRNLRREFCSTEHKNECNSLARNLGRKVLVLGLPPERVVQLVMRAAAAPVRRKRQEHVYLGRMTQQERLGALCAAAERYGVIKQ